jgi:hypothetical protein
MYFWKKASNRARTGDLFLTMEALYLLSYGSKINQVTEAVNHFSCEANKIYYKEV